MKTKTLTAAGSPSESASCSPSLKLLRLYHFELPECQRWGGVWRANGVTFHTTDTQSNRWRMVRVMATAVGQQIGEERETLEVILLEYCKEVRFHPVENVRALAQPGAQDSPNTTNKL